LRGAVSKNGQAGIQRRSTTNQTLNEVTSTLRPRRLPDAASSRHAVRDADGTGGQQKAAGQDGNQSTIIITFIFKCIIEKHL